MEGGHLRRPERRGARPARGRPAVGGARVVVHGGGAAGLERLERAAGATAISTVEAMLRVRPVAYWGFDARREAIAAALGTP